MLLSPAGQPERAVTNWYNRWWIDKGINLFLVMGIRIYADQSIELIGQPAVEGAKYSSSAQSDLAIDVTHAGEQCRSGWKEEARSWSLLFLIHGDFFDSSSAPVLSFSHCAFVQFFNLPTISHNNHSITYIYISLRLKLKDGLANVTKGNEGNVDRIYVFIYYWSNDQLDLWRVRKWEILASPQPALASQSLL
jgi:hypothetical protein